MFRCMFRQRRTKAGICMKRVLRAALALAIAVFLFGSRVEPVSAAVDQGTGALWDLSIVPGTPNWTGDNSTTGVELGVRFQSSEEIWVTGVRFYKGDQNTGTHSGSLWTTDGTLLEHGTFTEETASGWQDVLFNKPEKVSPGQIYVASYFSPNSKYSAENFYFNQPRTVGPVTALGGANGVYRYSDVSVYPDFTYLNSNYWVT